MAVIFESSHDQIVDGEHARTGFTLIEAVVTVAIIGIMAALVTVAFVNARQQQSLVLAQQKIQFWLRDAQKRAIQEEREPDCQTQSEDTRRCSEVGVYIKGQEIKLFADTTGNDRRYTPTDRVIAEDALPLIVKAEDEHHFVFVGQPPSVTLWHNSLLVEEPSEGSIASDRLTLTTAATSVNLTIHPFGQLERE